MEPFTVADRTGEPSDGRIAISLLGPFMLHGFGRRRGLRSATEQLIAYLALHPQGASRDELLEALWPEQDPRRTRPRLWQSVTQARKVLGDEAFVRDRDRYRIDLDLVEVDLVELDRLIAAAKRAVQPAERRRPLEQALSLVRGQPLIDIDLPWAHEAARQVGTTIATLLDRTGRARLATASREPRSKPPSEGSSSTS